MPGARRQIHGYSEGKSIPGEYTQLEYIESKSTSSFVDIAYKVNYKSKIRAKYMDTDAATGYIRVPFGVVNGTPSVSDALSGFARLYQSNGRFNRVTWGNGAGTVGDVNEEEFPYDANVRYELFYNLNVVTMYINGVRTGTKTLTASSNWESDEDFSLFARARVGGSHDMWFIGRIAYFNIEEDGITTLNLLPVERKADGKLGYYDTVSSTFFPCTSYGTWQGGPAIN